MKDTTDLKHFDENGNVKFETRKVKLYAIKDIALGAFGDVMTQANDEVVKQALGHYIVSNPDSKISLYGSQYQLWCLGDFTLETGEIAFESEFICDISALAMPLKKSA